MHTDEPVQAENTFSHTRLFWEVSGEPARGAALTLWAERQLHPALCPLHVKSCGTHAYKAQPFLKIKEK